MAMNNAGDQATLNALNEQRNGFVLEAEMRGLRAEGKRREIVSLRLVVDATTLEVSRLTDLILRLQQQQQQQQQEQPNVPEPMLAERIAMMNQLLEGHQARLPIVEEEIVTATTEAEAFQAASDAAQSSANEIRALISETLKTMGM